MPEPISAGIAAVTAIGGSVIQSKASKKATNAQTAANDQAIAEQRRQFDALQGLLRPYTNAGPPALQGLMNLAGLGQKTTNWKGYAESNPALMAAYQEQLNRPATASQGGAGAPYGLGDSPGMAYNPAMMGDMYFNPQAYAGMGGGGRFGAYGVPEAYGMGGIGLVGDNGMMGNMAGNAGPMSLEDFAQQYYQQNGGDISQFETDPQQAEFNRIEQSQGFQAMAKQGEDAILQNASATGGLRGGNTQGSLARFRPALLSQFIDQQYGRLAGLTSLGQQSAAGVGTAGLQTGQNISGILQDSGLARAANAGAQGQIWSNLLGQLGGMGANAAVGKRAF